MNRIKARRLLVHAVAVVVSLLFSSSCILVSETFRTGGERQLNPVAPPPKMQGPHVIIFALDGTVPDLLMQAIRSGQARRMRMLFGNDQGGGLFEHAYAAPHALSVLPSSTIADWSAIFTGDGPASNGVPGDEWFERQTMRFYAPVPVSLNDITDNTKTITDDLVGKELRVPTLYELLGKRSYVSMLSVHRGATYYTTVSPASFASLLFHLVSGTLSGDDPEKSLSSAIDHDSVAKVIEAIEEHGIPDLQVVYFPGIDIFTHAANPPFEEQLHYLQDVTDPAVGQVLDEYLKKDSLRGTYVIFIADHAQIPTLDDEHHELGTDEEDSPFAAVSKAGFRVREPSLISGDTNRDYQAVLAYQGFMAYVYLADRSTCSKVRDQCNWKKPPRFEEDIMPVLRSFDRSNRFGRPIRKLKGTIDLIFARQPVSTGEKALPYEIFDGHDLVPIPDYLIDHPRPDLPDLEQRMRWLSAGPYGDRAGDILLLARSCTKVPIRQRYYFAAITHHTWHGSACEQDSHIPFILAQQGGSGEDMRSILRKFGGDSPSERRLTPLVLKLFGLPTPETK